ncbi:MAG TPA: glycosyltransferase [Gammaproteobacteria bacterium]|nr:glycosyltransferase [Gammaproteobacteria bacterium]
MRIAQIMLAKRFGGAERSFVDLCAELVARGHEVLAICETRAAALPLLARIEGLEVRSVRVWGAWDLFARLAIARSLRAHRAAIVQCHLARAAHLGGAAARGLGLPALAKTHNYVDLRYYRAIDCLVPTTRAQEDYLLAHGIEPRRVTRIPNFSRLVPREPASQPPASPVRLFALGRLVEKKGFDVLLDALAALPPAVPPVVLTLAGDGPLRAALEARAGALAPRVAVRFLGWVEEVTSAFAAADLFVLPSRDEPFGIVVLEAMAAGVPIIATRTAGPLEVLDAETARLVDVGDVAGLAAAIAADLADPASARRRAVRASAVFRQRYSAAAVVPRYERLYEELVARRAPASPSAAGRRPGTDSDS